MENTSENPVSTAFGEGRVLFDYHVQSIEGRMLTLLETLGLPEKQESALKDVARGIIHSLYEDPMYITGQAVNAAYEITRKSQQATRNV